MIIKRDMQTNYKVTSGRSYPLGATVKETGVNFAIFSAHAEQVELCLFDATGQHEIQRIVLPEFTDDVWHGFVPNLPAGTLYGYRIHGPFEPHNGHRFNRHKLLIDPYAKKLSGNFTHHDSHYGFDREAIQQDLTFDITDNAAYLPKCVVVADSVEKCVSHPQVRRRNTIVYELHVKGFTQLNKAVKKSMRGTYKGLSDDAVIEYLVKLGVTSVELLPVHSFLDEPFVQEKGLSNYWGYNSFNFFVPQQRYLYGEDEQEFRDMVECFHEAGIEVILDVVYNHTAEGSELGPTFCYRGIDNASYYRLLDEDKRFYHNHSGCGNTLNIDHPRVLQLVADSLRYWVERYGVDGFRFDLAPILGRTADYFTSANHFFSVLRQDPVLSSIKLIAEPWDIGMGGYQLGRFPKAWLEWNDRFRDTCRRFWRGDKGMSPEFARRLHGSADLFEQPSRRPSSSVNFITSHDGFTLHDLVTFEERHNYANCEDNRDGHGANYSCNFGVEGETDNLSVNQKRYQQKRNLLSTLFIAQGTPMLLAGDELGNSQKGNNNAYCQDNELTWLDWQNADQELLAFVRHLIQLRKDHPLLNRSHYQHGMTFSDKTELADISWLNCHGNTMQESDWHDNDIKCFAMLLADTDHEGESDWENEHDDDAMLVIFNAHSRAIDYQLPALSGQWQILVNTADKLINKAINIESNTVALSAYSLMMLSFSHVSSDDITR